MSHDGSIITLMDTKQPSLDILSDPICPWCYIGKAKFDSALAEFGPLDLDVQWRTYQLNPEMPEGGMDRQTYLDNKFGGRDAARQVYGRIEDAVEAAGLPADFSKIGRTPNTLDAHRLIRWSSSTGKQNAVVDALFEAYFLNGVDIGDRAALIDIGQKLDMDTDLLNKLFEEDADRTLLLNEDALARQMGVTGVPCFILDETYALVGAQEKATWLDVFGRISRKEPLGS